MQSEFPVKNFAGLNLLDAADSVADNEFSLLQNVWQPSKGVFAPRWGSVLDQNSFPMASRISGLWRHVGQHENITLYHCSPNTTAFPDNSDDLVLTESTGVGGNIFNGGAVQTIRVCYAYFGCGMEQSFNTKNRAGYVSTKGINAWAQTGHQTITLGSNTSGLLIQGPSIFPVGVQGINIFASVGTTCQMVYIGSITTLSGTLLFKRYIGPYAAASDPSTLPGNWVTALTGGSLKAGTYYVAAAWLCDNNQVENPSGDYTPVPSLLMSVQTVVVPADGYSIEFFPSFVASVNGASSIYLFIGTQPPTLSPMFCVGVAGSGDVVTITSLPTHNGQTHPFTVGKSVSYFMNPVLSSSTTNAVRTGFVMAVGSGGYLYEVCISRSLFWLAHTSGYYAGYDPTVNAYNFLGGQYLGYLKTANDTFTSHPENWGLPVQDPVFAYQQGVSYFVNGCDSAAWMTDGYCLGQLTNGYVSGASVPQTILPPVLQTIFTYHFGLVGSPAIGSQFYASNANQPQNWAQGGSGTALIFATIGDAHGGGIKASGTFTPSGINIPLAEATNNPGSYVIAFKKTGIWITSSIVNTAPMVQVSGEIGCVAYRSVCHTTSGTAFIGSDANIYLINSLGQPVKIGTKIQNALQHLVGNDRAMQCVTAVFHNWHYKISYPSPSNVATNTYVNDSELWADFRTEFGPIKWMGPHIGRNIGAQIVLAQDGDNMDRLVCDGVVVRTYVADSINALTDLNASGVSQKIVQKVTSKIYRFGKEAHVKRYFGAILDMYIDSSYSNTVLFEGFSDSNYNSVNRQLSNGGATWDSSQWDQTTYADAAWQGFSFLFAQNNLIGRTFQWSITKSDAAPFVLASATLLMKPEKRRLVA